MTTRFCLVRHGETDWNAEGRLQGQLDIGLNASGRAQAKAAATRLAACRFDAIFSSDLERAYDTAVPMGKALGLPVETTPALRERFFGAFQGLTHAEAQALFPADYARFAARDPEAPLPGDGESLCAFSRRVGGALNHLADELGGNTILIVAHGGVLDMARRLASGQDLRQKRDFTLLNAALNWIERRDGQWAVQSWGDVAHLDGSLDEILDAAGGAGA
ncbi:histidine phosphatase family protein [Methylocella silvestris]|uniref:Histidine phosphatase family protein n=1 Tax=Methylocella silvestris TaxID=199596 RepID=A0A2J7THB7_METSI|nr:histidine phosphatase family protein [Methylocella silvestris]PNG26162.1 histidine phosphatase family protein [Methylocella silvestris]